MTSATIIGVRFSARNVGLLGPGPSHTRHATASDKNEVS